jgi:hypothetical protein
MDPYSISKSQWRSRRNPQPTGRHHHYENTSRRHAFKTKVNNDLYEEYRVSGPRDQKSATTFIKWFDSVEDDFEETAQNEQYPYSYLNDEVDWDQYSLCEFIGDDEEQYAAILRGIEERRMQRLRDVVMAWLMETADYYYYDPQEDWELVWLESGTFEVIGNY